MSSWRHLGCVTAALLPILLTGCCENPNSFIGRDFCGKCVANVPPQPNAREGSRITANAPPQTIVPETYRVAANDSSLPR